MPPTIANVSDAPTFAPVTRLVVWCGFFWPNSALAHAEGSTSSVPPMSLASYQTVAPSSKCLGTKSPVSLWRAETWPVLQKCAASVSCDRESYATVRPDATNAHRARNEQAISARRRRGATQGNLPDTPVFTQPGGAQDRVRS